jgi:hypothetical protein
MTGLSSELYQQCRSTLLRCSEFDSDVALKAVFVTAELRQFRDSLPEAASKSNRVDSSLDFLLDQRLSDGATALFSFLDVLRQKYEMGSSLRDELDELIVSLPDTFKAAAV